MSNSKYFILSSLLFFFSQGIAQSSSLRSTKTDMAKISITGTSTLHEWKVSAGEISGLPEHLALELKEGTSIDHFSFKIKVSSLDGGRGAAMNKKIRNALKATKHPDIIYTQTLPAKIQNLQSDNHFTLTSTGLLQIAGVTKEVIVNVSGQKNSAGKLTFKGSKALKFSDFEIEPPSAMFGQIVCGEDITVHFELAYAASE